MFSTLTLFTEKYYFECFIHRKNTHTLCDLKDFFFHSVRLYDELGCLCLFSSICLWDSFNRKRELLSREDLELSWRPLYELHDRILFSKTEHLGLNWFPKYASVLRCCWLCGTSDNVQQTYMEMKVSFLFNQLHPQQSFRRTYGVCSHQIFFFSVSDFENVKNNY